MATATQALLFMYPFMLLHASIHCCTVYATIETRSPAPAISVRVAHVNASPLKERICGEQETSMLMSEFGNEGVYKAPGEVVAVLDAVIAVLGKKLWADIAPTEVCARLFGELVSALV